MSIRNKQNIHESFIKFLYTAHLKTYAGTDLERKKTKRDKSKIEGHQEYYYSDKDWIYFDSYAGYIFPPGKEIIYYKKEPFWAMSYQGQYISNEKITAKRVYEFLREALRHTDPNNPFRGPKKYMDDDWKYIFEIKGDWKYFTGKEKIYYKKRLIFFQDIIGSIII
jgi:hypothetical protein